MKKVESHQFQTATMRKFRLEQELAELRAVDPALADKHLKETLFEIWSQVFTALLWAGAGLYILFVVL
jgi:hypothetical protein